MDFDPFEPDEMSDLLEVIALWILGIGFVAVVLYICFPWL